MEEQIINQMKKKHSISNGFIFIGRAKHPR